MVDQFTQLFGILKIQYNKTYGKVREPFNRLGCQEKGTIYRDFETRRIWSNGLHRLSRTYTGKDTVKLGRLPFDIQLERTENKDP